jgi:cysteine desulfurase
MQVEELEQLMAIYLDGHATTVLAPEAREAMLAAWSHVGNSNSPHSAGARAAATVATARGAVARLIGADPTEIVFTSGATEANNLALLGGSRAAVCVGSSRRRVIVSAIEHKAVLAPAHVLKAEGLDVIEAPVNQKGQLDLEIFAQLINAETLLVSVMAANNEVGVIQPVRTAATLAREMGALIHCDAAQAAGKIPLDVFDLDVDYLSLSAHKLHGPLGVGALYISASAPRPLPLVVGGGQEGGVRAGTLPVPLIAGFGAAAELAAVSLDRDAQHARSLARRFIEELANRRVGFEVVCASSDRLPGSLSLTIPGADGEDLVEALADTAHISTGSACNSGSLEPSYVLRSIGLSYEQAKSTIRLLFGRYNTLEEATETAALLADACERVRRLATGGCHQ